MAKKASPANPVKTADADAFSMYVREWQDRLNLRDWRIVRSSKSAARTSMAEVTKMDLEARLATYRIGTDFGSVPVTAQSVEEIACHEVLHVFLYELIAVAKENKSDSDINSVEHRCIQSLVRLLVPEN